MFCVNGVLGGILACRLPTGLDPLGIGLWSDGEEGGGVGQIFFGEEGKGEACFRRVLSAGGRGECIRTRTPNKRVCISA